MFVAFWIIIIIILFMIAASLAIAIFDLLKYTTDEIRSMKMEENNKKVKER